MKKIIITFFTCLYSLTTIYSQLLEENYFQGYHRGIQGFTLNYHSPLPDVNSSLLIRARGDFNPIEWETELVPADFNQHYASFVWMYGIDTDIEGFDYDIYINDKKYLTFRNPVNNDSLSWRVEGLDGTVLTFNLTMVDKYHDQMGFATLKLPRSAIVPGERVRIKIVGEDAGNNRWYMTFKAGIHEEISISQENVVLNENNNQYHIARFDFTHLGKQVRATVKVNNAVAELDLLPGYNSVDLLLPVSDSPTLFNASIKIGNRPELIRSFTMKPVPEWTVYMVQHTHTDIGYTRPQTEILPEHLRYIDYALDYCDLTDNYPEDAKFKWTCEASWPVREYLSSRPKEQIERLVSRVKEGRIEVTGMFFNYSEIADETILAAQTKTLKQIKDINIPVTTSMQNDVNGIGWCLADYFQGTGVKYLIMGQHGHRARIPFNKPTAFWWESPSGNRLLAYRSEHYMYGNSLGLTSGDISVFRKNLTSYLTNLEERGYPFHRTAFQFSGYITDNSPPSTIACDIVKEWNEKYEWPKLIIATANEFMQYLEENHSNELPVKKVAWPDWWTDGAGSAMNETKAVRNTHSEMIANTGLFSMAAMMGAELPEELNKDITSVQDALLFYDEHTYGAAESISDPLAENTIIQWNEKASYAWEAVKKSRMLTEKAMGYIQPYIGKSDVPSMVVFNTLNWPRSGLVSVYIDHEILPTNKEFSIVDSEGNSLSVQAINSRSDGTYWGIWVEDIPAMGIKKYEIVVSDYYRIVNTDNDHENILENEFYKLKIDNLRGVITSLFDKELNLELIDIESEMKLGEFIYEELANRHQMERYTHNKIDTVFVPLEGERYRLTDIIVEEKITGPVWNSIFIHGNIAGCADERGVNIEVRLYNESKLVELHYSMHKLPVITPESVYISFPFSLSEGRISFEAQGGLVYPGDNQLEGTASDWNTIQSFASIHNDNAQIIFGSSEVPLVQFGDINTGRYYYKHTPETNNIYSWVLNNYWTTNFRGSQEGEMKWSYYITSSGDNSNSKATQFGWGNRIPLMTRVLPAGIVNYEESSLTLLDIDIPGVLLISASPAIDKNGIILHLRETNGKQVTINKKNLLDGNKYSSAIEINILEEAINRIESEVTLDPWESKFIKLIP